MSINIFPGNSYSISCKAT